MLRSLVFVATFSAAAAFAGQCDAQVSVGAPSSGYTFFNRPDASMAEHDEDLSECAVAAGSVRSYSESYPLSPIVLRLVEGMISQGWTDAVHLAALENCMVVRRWRVVRLDNQQGEALGALAKADLTSRLSSMISSNAPEGAIVRQWNNDAASAANDRYTMRPDATHSVSLSLLASGVALATEREPVEAHADDNEGWPSRSIAAAQVASAPPTSATIVFRIQGGSQHNGVGITFMRINADDAIATDHARNVLHVGVGTLFARREGNWLAFVVPPGRWRLSTMGGIPTLNFCLGAPSFEVSAGEIVYGGSFDLGGSALGPDLTLDSVRGWFSGQQAAERVRAAVYTNGWTAPCGSNEIYAMEIPGVEFREGYHWGSAH